MNDTNIDEKNIDSYRFSSGEEPSDEILNQLMKEVAETACEQKNKAIALFFNSLQSEVKNIKKSLVTN